MAAERGSAWKQALPLFQSKQVRLEEVCTAITSVTKATVSYFSLYEYILLQDPVHAPRFASQVPVQSSCRYCTCKANHNRRHTSHTIKNMIRPRKSSAHLYLETAFVKCGCPCHSLRPRRFSGSLFDANRTWPTAIRSAGFPSGRQFIFCSWVSAGHLPFFSF